MPVSLEFLSVLWFLGGLASISLALLGMVAPSLVQGPVLVLENWFLDPLGALRRPSAQIASWVGGRIPGASAESVALFRIVFGCALLIIVLGSPVVATWAIDPSNVVAPAQRLMLRIFVDAPWVGDWLQPWVIFWGALFLVGAFARTAFAFLTIGAFAWASLYTIRTSITPSVLSCWRSSRCSGRNGATRGASTPGDGDAAGTRNRAVRRSNTAIRSGLQGSCSG